MDSVPNSVWRELEWKTSIQDTEEATYTNYALTGAKEGISSSPNSTGTPVAAVSKDVAGSVQK